MEFENILILLTFLQTHCPKAEEGCQAGSCVVCWYRYIKRITAPEQQDE